MTANSRFGQDVIERRKTFTSDQCPRAQWFEQAEERLNAGAAVMAEMHAELLKNTEATKQAQAETSEVLDILRLGKSFFRVIGYIRSFIIWVAALAAPLIAIFFTIKGGGDPTK